MYQNDVQNDKLLKTIYCSFARAITTNIYMLQKCKRINPRVQRGNHAKSRLTNRDRILPDLKNIKVPLQITCAHLSFPSRNCVKSRLNIITAGRRNCATTRTNKQYNASRVKLALAHTKTRIGRFD